MAGKLLQRPITPGPGRDFPVKHRIRILYILTLVIAVLVSAVSIAGIIFRQDVYLSDDITGTFVPNDYVNLIVGLPLMLVSVLLASRGRLAGLLSLPGAVFYFVYVYFPYIIAVPPGCLFIPYLVIFTSCIYILIGIITAMDGDTIRDRMSAALPVKLFGGILAGLGILILSRQTYLIIEALVNDTATDYRELSVWIDDFVIGAPAMIIVGVMLWKRKSTGFLLAPGLYLAYGALSVGLIPYIIIQSRSGGAPTDISSVIVLLIMSAACIIPYIILLRGLSSRKPEVK